MLMLRVSMTEPDMLRFESIFDLGEPPRAQRDRARYPASQRDPQ